MQTQVGIIGAGPAGLLLSHLLHLSNIESVVIEQCSQDYVQSRVRAGVLEQGSVDLLQGAGLGQRMLKEGLAHHGIELRFDNRSFHIDFDQLTNGQGITVYGQQEVVKDLIAARIAARGQIFFDSTHVSLHDLQTEHPYIEFDHDNATSRLQCDFIVGCDGFHGVSRKSIPDNQLTTFERRYPFSWLGILVEAPPSSKQLIYANTPQGFALHSMRSGTITRNYLQCAVDDDSNDWSDDRIWASLHQRLETLDGWKLIEGNILEKGMTPMRSFVCETMRYGNLFLAGDAAHIVPPTGAKGLNLAFADVNVLSQAMIHWYMNKNSSGLERYAESCLKKIWRGEHFSWWLTSLLHKFPDSDDFQQRLQLSELNYLCNSSAAARVLAENYVGYRLPMT